jgi:hypothetical protein
VSPEAYKQADGHVGAGSKPALSSMHGDPIIRGDQRYQTKTSYLLFCVLLLPGLQRDYNRLEKIQCGFLSAEYLIPK